MIRTHSVYEACKELFTDYPLATKIIDDSGTIRSMVLLLREGSNVGFFVLSHDTGKRNPVFSLHPWREANIADIEADGSTAISDMVVNVVTRGVPIPRHGSLFGWRFRGTITALVAFYAEYTPARPQPSWAVMPRVGVEKTQWPPFTDEPIFGHWFWDYHRAGGIISLDRLIAEMPDTVFWVDTKGTLGSDCCAVARDIRSQEGHTLRRGRYVYHQPLRAGRAVPSLSMLIADAGKTDLALRFAISGLGSRYPQDEG